MKSQSAVALAAIACLALASCGEKGKPKGQVVATVGKTEVTALELQGELAGFRAPDAKIRKLAEQQALNAIVQRKLLAQEARKEKLDRSPEYARQRDRVDEALLVKIWQDQLVRAVPAPSIEEAQRFVSEHPDIYAARKHLTIDGVRFAPPPNDPTLSAALQPLKTLDEVRALLTARNIQFRSGTGEIDAFTVDPRMVEQLMKLKPDEVFVLPQGNVVFVGHINGSRVDPIANDLAIRHATEFLKQVRIKESVERRFGGVVQSGLKGVKYAKGYEPPTPPKAPAKAAAPPAVTQPAAAKPN